jgi:hypothetical protein
MEASVVSQSLVSTAKAINAGGNDGRQQLHQFEADG